MLSNIVKTGALMAICSTLAVAAPVADASLAKRAAPSCTDSSFSKAALNALNAHRSVHGAPDLEYSSELAQYAQGVSDTCTMAHSGGPYGENLYQVSPGIQGSYEDATASAIFDWAKEIWDYDFNNPGFSMGTGHATALLWKSTKKVGCAWTDCGNSAMFTCNFDDSVPNMMGEFQNNVLRYKKPSSY